MLVAVTHASLSPLPALAFLDGIGGMEMILVAIIGLLLFGGKGLPDMARTLGRVVREFKKATQGVEDEVRRVMDEDSATQSRPRPRPRSLPTTLPAPAPSAIPPAPTPTAPAGSTAPSVTSPSPADQPGG